MTSDEYTYNADGIRTSKTVDGIRHDYYLNGTQIIAETWTLSGIEYLLYYLYDETGSPIGMQYRTSNYASRVFDAYFFEKNVQGDIIGVYNSTGKKIGAYTYDAWGKCSLSVLAVVRCMIPIAEIAASVNCKLNLQVFRLKSVCQITTKYHIGTRTMILQLKIAGI